MAFSLERRIRPEAPPRRYLLRRVNRPRPLTPRIKFRFLLSLVSIHFKKTILEVNSDGRKFDSLQNQIPTYKVGFFVILPRILGQLMSVASFVLSWGMPLGSSLIKFVQ